MASDLPASLIGNRSRQEKLLLARGAGLGNAQPQLELLVALAAEDDAEISSAAAETLSRIPDEEFARSLAESRMSPVLTRFLLNPRFVRPNLLPRIVRDPDAPQEAIEALAASANPEVVACLLAELEHLRTPVLLALKSNPAYLAWQKAPQSKRTSEGHSESDEIELERNPITARLARMPGPEALAKTTGETSIRHLVALTSGPDKSVSEAAQAALARLSDEECIAAVAEESLDGAVARYFLDPSRIRPRLLPILLSHPDTPQDAIVWLAAKADAEVVPLLLDEIDLLRTPALSALKDNPTYLAWQKNPPAQGYVLEVDLLEMLIREMELEAERSTITAEETPVAAIETTGDEKKDGIIRKIAKMNVAQRVKLALLGSREERALLIRDPSRVVWRAVLSSPKLNEADVESFAAMKNISQEILRHISMNRKFMKNYTILKNLATNPRLPIDLALPMLNRLLPQDLRTVAASKDVPDTTRKMAQKLLKARMPAGSQG